jgi:hypothetical protein
VIARTALCALVLFVLVGCQKEQPPAPAETPPAAATPAAPAETASAVPAATGPEIPTEEDFEEEAGRELTAANLDAQLDALEKEITAE